MSRILLIILLSSLFGCADPGSLRRIVEKAKIPAPVPAKSVISAPSEVIGYFKFHERELSTITDVINEAKTFKNLRIVVRTDDIVFHTHEKQIKVPRIASFEIDLPIDSVDAKSTQTNLFAKSFGKFVLIRSISEPSLIKLSGRNASEIEFLKSAVVNGCTEKIFIETSVGAPMLAFVSIGSKTRMIKNGLK